MSQSVCFRFVGSALVLISGVLTLFAPTVAQSAVVSSTSAPDFASAQYISSANFSTISNPNVLDSTTIPYAVIVQYGRASEGRDYYRFSHSGGTVHLDIDSDPQVTNFDTMIAIWDPGGNLLAVDDDGSADPGDIPGEFVGGFFNSNLSNLNLTAGDYIVSVSSFHTGFGFGGSADSTIGSRFGTPGKPRPIRLRSRTRQRVDVCGSWNCSAMAGSCDPPALQITWAAASRPSNANSKPSAWPAASSSSARAKLGRISWWERECDVGLATIPSSFERTDG